MPNQSSLGFIQTPRYPDAYPRMLVKNYTLINRNQSGFVRLTFDDFHVHYQSELKVAEMRYSTQYIAHRPRCWIRRAVSCSIRAMSIDDHRLCSRPVHD